MTERLAAVQRRIESLRQLEAVVTAMRSIALSRSRQCRTHLVGIRVFARTVAEAIEEALPLLGDGWTPPNRANGRAALIVFCAEQGFAGAFSERVLDEAQPVLHDTELLLIGSRGIMVAEQRQLSPVWTAAMPPHVEGLPLLAHAIAGALYELVARSEISHVEALFAAWSAPGRLTVGRQRLLPFDYGRFPGRRSAFPPLTTLPAGLLLSRLSEEYVFAEICEVAAISFSAENEARAAGMIGAKRNIERIGGGLNLLERQVRQEDITAEISERSAAALLTRSTREPLVESINHDPG